MMAVMIGIIMQVLEDGILSPSSLFFFVVSGQVVVTGLLHPQEVKALIYGIVYYITIPSMYMLLVIYSLFNLNDVSWGTRENPQVAAAKKVEAAKSQPKTKMSKILEMFQSNKEEDGSIDVSIAGCFRCMLCTHTKSKVEHVQLAQISTQIQELDSKLKQLEM